MSNISSMIHMLFRYAVFIVIVIILLIIGLMFFYFTNQITYQNNKINTMFGIVTEMVQKDIQPLNIPFKPLSTCLLLILLSSLSLITACGCYMCLYICLYFYDYHRKRSITYDRLGSVV